jgi:hypothetical protein
MDSSSHRFPQLEGCANYEEWSDNIESFLIVKELWDSLQKGVLQADGTWGTLAGTDIANDRKALAYIKLFVNGDVKMRLKGCTTAAKALHVVFAWPGLGLYMKNSLFAADLNAVVGGTVLIGVIYIVLNMVSDVIYTLVDPRARARK